MAVWGEEEEVVVLVASFGNGFVARGRRAPDFLGGPGVSLQPARFERVVATMPRRGEGDANE